MVLGNYRCGRHAAAIAAIAVSLAAQQRPDSSVRRATGQPPKTILAVADVSTDTYQHDSISHALAVIEDLGLRAGIYDTVIRTDVQLVTKGAIAAATGTLTFYKNLDDFDAVVWLASGEPALTSEQKQGLLSSVREGKGFVVIHSGIGAFPSWPEFAEMIGGRTLEQPDNIKDFDVSVDAPDFLAMGFFSKSFRVREVLSPVVLSQAGQVRVLADSRGIPVVWIKNYGKGRIFASQLGHADAVWDRRDVRQMVLEAIRWTMHETP